MKRHITRTTALIAAALFALSAISCAQILGWNKASPPAVKAQGKIIISIPRVSPALLSLLNLPETTKIIAPQAAAPTAGARSGSRTYLSADRTRFELFASGNMDDPIDSWDSTEFATALSGNIGFPSVSREVPSGESLVLKASLFNSATDADVPEVVGYSEPFTVAADGTANVTITCLPNAPTHLDYDTMSQSYSIETCYSMGSGSLTLGTDMWFEFTPTDPAFKVEILPEAGSSSVLYGLLYDAAGALEKMILWPLRGCIITASPNSKHYLGLVDLGSGPASQRSFSVSVRKFDMTAATSSHVSYQSITPTNSVSYDAGPILGTAASGGQVAIVARGSGFVTAWTDAAGGLHAAKVGADGAIEGAVATLVSTGGSNPGSVFLYDIGGIDYLVWLGTGDDLQYFKSADGLAWGVATSMLASSANASSVSASLSGSVLNVAWHGYDNGVYFASYDFASPSPASATEIASEAEYFNGPGIASSGDDIFVAYGRWNPSGQCALLHSADKGVTWSKGVIAGTHFAQEFDMSYDGTTLYIAMENDKELLRSTDAGANFTYLALQADNYGSLAFAATDSGLFVASESSPATGGLEFAHSADSGSSWTAHDLPDRLAPRQSSIAIATNGANPAIIYVNAGGSVVFQYSSDGGSSWLTGTHAVTSIGKVIQGSTSAASDNGNYLCGIRAGKFILSANSGRDGNAPLSLIRSLDGGAAWEAGALLSGSPSALCSMTYSGGTAYLCYSDWGATYVASSSDQGVNWSTRVVDAVFGNGDAGTSLWVSGSNLLVSYKDYQGVGSSSQKLAVSHDGGGSFAIKVIDNVVSYSESRLVGSGSKLWLAYNNDESRLLRVASSTDGGDTWSVPTSDTAIACDGNFDMKLDPDGHTLMVLSAGKLWSAPDGSSFSQLKDTGASGSNPSFFMPALAAVSSVATTYGQSFFFGSLSGVTWSSVTIDGADAARADAALLPDASGQDIWVLWKSAMGLGVKVNHSSNGGVTWDYPTN